MDRVSDSIIDGCFVCGGGVHFPYPCKTVPIPDWGYESWVQEHRTIIAGGRDVHEYWLVDYAVYQSGFVISQVISGGARGIDTVGEAWAMVNGLPVEIHYADWDRYGKAAGYKRNSKMADVAAQLVAVWDGNSRGTGNMIKIATERDLKVHVLRIDLL
jgi:hypothetical protein